MAETTDNERDPITGWSRFWAVVEKHGWPIVFLSVFLFFGGQRFLQKDDFIQTKLMDKLDNNTSATTTQTEVNRQQIATTQKQTDAIEGLSDKVNDLANEQGRVADKIEAMAERVVKSVETVVTDDGKGS